MRVPVIAGNWKMYKNRGEAAASSGLPFRWFRAPGGRDRPRPAVPVDRGGGAACEKERRRVASQNVHFAGRGAFTGECPPGC